MDSEKRRKRIIEVLEKATGPITGAELSRQCHVSRQIIVGDVAMLRAHGEDIISTPRGYQLHASGNGGIQRTFVVCHGPDQVRAELEAIVDNGGTVQNVVIEHDVYGYLEGTLRLRSRRDIEQYIKKMAESKSELLSRISGGIHSHVVEAASEEDLQAIEEALEKLHILYKQ